MRPRGDLFRPTPPHSGSDASRAAAGAIESKSPGLRAIVLATLKNTPGGATSQDLEEWLELSGNTVRPRLRELVQAGRVYDSGERRTLSATGRKAIVWRAH